MDEQRSSDGYYIRHDDVIQVEFRPDSTSNVLQVNGRIELPDGDTVDFAREFRQPVAYGTTVGVIKLPIGKLIGILIKHSARANSASASLAHIALLRGELNSGANPIILFTGNIRNFQKHTWGVYSAAEADIDLGGNKTISITNPAAGANLSTTGISNSANAIRALAFTLVTDATVATRTIALSFTDDAGQQFLTPIYATQLAGQTMRYMFAEGIGNLFTVAGGGTFAPLPTSDFLKHATVATVIGNIQAADQISTAAMIRDEVIGRAAA